MQPITEEEFNIVGLDEILYVALRKTATSADKKSAPPPIPIADKNGTALYWLLTEQPEACQVPHRLAWAAAGALAAGLAAFAYSKMSK